MITKINAMDGKIKYSPDWLKNGNPLPNNTPGMFRGVPVSQGFGDGIAYYIKKRISFADIGFGKAFDVHYEIDRIEKAFVEAENQICDLCQKIQCRLTSEDEAIINAYLMTLKDGGLKAKIKASILQGNTAEFALKEVILDYVKIFSKMEDPYFRERGSDIETLGEGILRNVIGLPGEETVQFDEKTILIASDISPADLILYRQDNLRGIILSKGGETSHVTILARSFEIPMVIRTGGVLSLVKERDFTILDGTSGLIFHKPSADIIQEYKRLEEEKHYQNEVYDSVRYLSAKTTDEFEIKLGANIGLLSDLSLVDKYGADHIGLYRTEFPFIARARFPDGDEQASLYSKIVRAAGGREVTIRTLDIGGDKFLSYLEYPREDNPYLGWRSIRVSLELKDVFREQLRAILQASGIGPVRLMFPMISSVRELKESLKILEEEKQLLRQKGIPFSESLPVGIMVEVPGAVIILDRLLRYADFVSVGTNDLVQYSLAVDRNNPKVASIYNPLHPAVISLIASVASTCKRLNKPMSICGEAAANAKCAYLFLGMGVRDISMNATSIPRLKHFIRQKSFKDAYRDLNTVLAMEDTDEIEEYLEGVV
ncbi:MAG: phosphoenolpyruvate--protein phosphotransferase [Syntrophales bacterium]|nr:phosphoenolpyruvate--protein phosphotransferase [Syntrophales bacterium]